MNWQEFCDFFFLKNDMRYNIDTDKMWWTKLDSDGNLILPKENLNNVDSNKNEFDTPDTDSQKSQRSQGSHSGEKKIKKSKLLRDFKEMSPTPQLDTLLHARKAKIEKDVED